ncbi:MAG: hypothetical protein JWM31_29 [Solirubrobacterales bacterium]|nr:hypothetical protein [Solirubrobacterales bacterium]
MARIRAALSYSKLKRDDFAAKVGISPSQLDLWSGKRATGSPPKAVSDYERLASAANLPLSFFFTDFDAAGDSLRGDTPEEVRRYIEGSPTQRARARAQAAARRLDESRTASPSSRPAAGGRDQGT